MRWDTTTQQKIHISQQKRLEEMVREEGEVTQEVISSSWQALDLMARSRSGGTTPALPLLPILPTSFSTENWKGNAGRAVPLPSSIYVAPFFLFFPSSSLSLDSTPKKIISPFSCISPNPPLSPSMPDTTKSATCGLNGNQTLTHSPLACRLFPHTLTAISLFSMKGMRRYRKTYKAAGYALTLYRLNWDGQKLQNTTTLSISSH